MKKTIAGSTLLAALLLSAGCGAPAEEAFVDAMAREHLGDSGELGAAERVTPASAGDAVRYATLDGQAVEGWLARSEEGRDTAGVILIHEWWGLNDNIKTVARQLADAGYLALAVDLYEGGVATDREGAMALMRQATAEPARLEENLRQAAAWLRGQGADRVGVIGWCFGGAWSLRASLATPEAIDATVIYYGRLVTDRDELARLDSPVLGIFGAEDGGIPVASVREFETALQELGKPASIYVYEGADHAFANPTGNRYQPEAAEDAWEKTLAFLAEHLRG